EIALEGIEDQRNRNPEQEHPASDPGEPAMTGLNPHRALPLRSAPARAPRAGAPRAATARGRSRQRQRRRSPTRRARSPPSPAIPSCLASSQVTAEPLGPGLAL